MSLWRWSGNKYEKVDWHCLASRMPATLFGSGQSLNDANLVAPGTVRFVQNRGWAKVDPHIWCGLDDPGLFGRELLDTPFRKVFRGNHAEHLVDGIRAREYPETYWADVEAMPLENILLSRTADTKFIWQKNTMYFTLHMMVWMGYRDIRLAGIDLHGHYYDLSDTLDTYSVANRKRIHQLMDEQFKFFQWFAPAAASVGIKLTNLSPGSRLAKIPEVYSFPNP